MWTMFYMIGQTHHLQIIVFGEVSHVTMLPSMSLHCKHFSFTFFWVWLCVCVFNWHLLKFIFSCLLFNNWFFLFFTVCLFVFLWFVAIYQVWILMEKSHLQLEILSSCSLCTALFIFLSRLFYQGTVCFLSELFAQIFYFIFWVRK